jgi:general secretion pathway protein B
MSYILDALQRADAERERGHVPGLHSQIVPPTSRKVPRARRWQAWHTAAVVAALLAFAGLWWWLGQKDGAESATTSVTGAAVEATPAVPPAAPVTPPSPAAAVAATAPEPVLPILAPPRPEPARPTPSKAPVNAVAEPAAAPAVAAPAPPTATPPAPAPAAAIATREPAAGPVRSFSELSPEARAQLPVVNVSGSTYSKNPALRMLIINGKVMQEGQEIAPGLKLETIGQRNAVLNHNGLRYSIGY